MVIELSGSPQAIKTDFKALRKGGRVSLTGLYSQEALFHLKKLPSLKVAMVKGFYHKNRYIC